MRRHLSPLLALACLPLHAQQSTPLNDSSSEIIEPSPLSEQVAISPLSPVQADEIIQLQEQAKEQRKAARLINQVNFHVLERKEVGMGERKLIMCRVAPPALPQKAQPAPSTISEEEILEMGEEIERRNSKPSRALHLVGRVIDGELTEVTWHDGGKDYFAYSNVDFTLFGGMVDIETEEAFYSVLVSATHTTRKEIQEQRRLARKEGSEYMPRRVPRLPPFSSDQAEYLIFEDQAELNEQEYVLKPLDAMHVFFDQNEATLRIEKQRMLALREARQRYEEANPEEPEDTVINFWPIKGSAYLNSDR